MKIDRLITLNRRLSVGLVLVRRRTALLFRRHLSVTMRCQVCALLASVSSLPSLAAAAPIRLDAYENKLGSATAYGHARYVRPLGEFSMGGATYPVNLVFNSNPADALGAFGPYWRIPLFASTVVAFNQYKLYWDGPDERRQFFVLDQSQDGRRGEEVFIERGKDWKATVFRRGEILIEALNEPDWTFRYKDGRLKTFRVGSAADRCRITWSGRGLPLYITNEASNRRVFEIQYRGATDPERILMGEQQIAVVMGDAQLTAPDGVSNYGNYRVSFLRSLTMDTMDAVETATFAYGKADSLKREVNVLDEARKAVAKTLDLAVNRMEISGGSEVASSRDWIEWEARSGFVTADSGSTYAVKNDSWDANVRQGDFDVTPASSAIRRLPKGGDEQRWSYDWNSGVSVYTDLATGEVVRRTVILSEGPANGKLRRREILKDGEWTLDRKNSYDPKGRPIRAIHGDDVRIWEWVDSRDGSRSSEFLNGALLSEKTYDRNGSLLKHDLFGESGQVRTFVYNGVTGNIVEYLEGNELVYRNDYNQAGKIARQRWKGGRDVLYSYRDDGSYIKKVLRPDLEIGEQTAFETYLYDVKGRRVAFINIFGEKINLLTEN